MESNPVTIEPIGSFGIILRLSNKRIIMTMIYLLFFVCPPLFFVLVVIAAIRSNKGLEDQIQHETDHGEFITTLKPESIVDENYVETYPKRKKYNLLNFQKHSEVDYRHEIRKLRQENQVLRATCQQYEIMLMNQKTNTTQ